MMWSRFLFYRRVQYIRYYCYGGNEHEYVKYINAPMPETYLAEGDAVTLEDSSVGNRYYHLDFRIDATVKIKVLNADGTVSEETVEGTVSNPIWVRMRRLKMS